MKYIFSILLLSTVSLAYAQETDSSQTETYNFTIVEQLPVYSGCDATARKDENFNCMNNSLVKHIAHNFVYPEEARQAGIQGKVYVSFIIEKDGTVSNVKVVRGVDKLLDDEAARVVKLIPTFDAPATQKGEPVRMQYTVPINARLGKTEKLDSKKKKKKKR